MRTITPALQALWEAGGPFVGDDRPHHRVTVEPDWMLTESFTEYADSYYLPYRWFQNQANDQVEVEVPNVQSIEWDRRVDADAGQCTIVLYNQWHHLNDEEGDHPSILGSPGYFTFGHGHTDAATRWGQTTNDWVDRLIPNAMIRTYQGYGGNDKTIAQAVADGNILLTGVWLIDTVRPGTDGMLTLECRDLGKLIIEQQLYRPLIPDDLYPLHYYRWTLTDAVAEGAPVYDSTDPIESGPGAEGAKYVTDIASHPEGDGYWLVGTDGGVFSFHVPFHGSRGGAGDIDNGPMVTIAADPLGEGYWTADTTGGVNAFDVDFYGAPTQPTASPVCAMEATPLGEGYWVCCEDGTVFEFGDAVHYGDQPPATAPIVDIVRTATGAGYWLLAEDGAVYTFGDAAFHGSGTVPSGETAVGLAAVDHIAGYWIAYSDGAVHAFGDCRVWAPNAGGVFAGAAAGAAATGTLNDPIFSMSVTPTGNGYYLVGGDGGVFTFGDARFWGSLPADYPYTVKTDGNYTDYADIVIDLLLWSGWLFYGDSTGEVYGVIETTGAYAEDPLPAEMFDKKPVADPINELRETVGYIMFVGDQGEFHWQSPNWYVLGSLLEDQTRETDIITIDEAQTLTDYQIAYSDENVRSKVTIASHDPDASLADTVSTTRNILPGSNLHRGMTRPAIWVNEHLTRKAEQRAMLDRIEDHITFSLRQGTVSFVANPAIQINDQVRIYERFTADTYIHYVRGLHCVANLDTGQYTMTATVNWLGADFGEE